MALSIIRLARKIVWKKAEREERRVRELRILLGDGWGGNYEREGRWRGRRLWMRRMLDT
jgi:hypothetical protein